MSLGGKCVIGGLRSYVKITVTILSVCLAVFLGGACSDEREHEVQGGKREVRIKTPPLRKALPLEEEATEPGEKGSLKNEVSSPKKEEISPSEEGQPEEQQTGGMETGRYKVRKGDSLFKIAGREEIYNDPLKWPSLFRLNMDKLGQIWVEEGLQYKEIPEGVELGFITASEAAKNLDKLGRKPWVVNVMSVRNSRQIGPMAIALMKNGHRVYLSMAKVRGKEWVRVRVGFFRDASEASAAQRKIMPMVNDAWLAKIGDKELEEFGGL